MTECDVDYEDAGEFMADCEIQWAVERENHPERFVRVVHHCGHPSEVYLAITSPTEADREAARLEEGSTLCSQCRPCFACAQKECVCPDPFADE